MAGIVVIGCADQSLAYELRSQLAEAAEVEVVGVAETTAELTALVIQHDPNLILVHDQLGPEPVHQVVRDLSLRRPAAVSIVVSSDNEAEAIGAAMDAGARGVLAYPLTFADVQVRVVNALEWSRHMMALLANAGPAETGARGRATVVAVTGSKGGVGTTTVATHLAWDIRRELPSHKVLLVDLDLEKGDVTSLIEARYRTSIADLAKVSQDLSVRTVADAVFEHESGLHLLLPPADVRDVEWVTPAAVRQIVALLRQQYDLVVIDVGAHVTPVQAAVVEIADEVISVVTPDLISLRALRRNLGWWDSLAVRKPEGVHVLLNKHSRLDEVQPETMRRLSPSGLMQTVLPDMVRRLETAANSRSPELVSEAAWWKGLRALGRELGVVRSPAAAKSAEPVLAPATVPPAQPSQHAQHPLAEAQAEVPVAPSRRDNRSTRREARERGSASVELLGVFPWVIVLVLIMWQLGVAGMTFVWTGYAASAAARSVALNETSAEVTAAARERMPSGMRSDFTVWVDPADESRVTVTSHVPLVAPGILSTPWTVEIDRFVVVEP
ncbi:AAA family ATPase [Pengzhenrongella sicca]|uniref:AAA family ATPase n=1 Tax=Pengzhenrongella sicca TaxID=2819238 RepID=A0A8A4ZEW3_9MICO|nr:AAA family ATPase [Pengzhenrongella sicca]QTE29951.1 AAA family ATPase [Pengzhenrongella sicca]